LIYKDKQNTKFNSLSIQELSISVYELYKNTKDLALMMQKTTKP